MSRACLVAVVVGFLAFVLPRSLRRASCADRRVSSTSAPASALASDHEIDGTMTDGTVTGAFPSTPTRDAPSTSSAERILDDGVPRIDLTASVAKLGITRDSWPEVAGVVICGESGSPVPFAELEVCCRSRSPWIRTSDDAPSGAAAEMKPLGARTDRNGAFRLRTCFDTQIVAHAPGFSIEECFVDRASATPEARVEISLYPAFLLKARVIDVDGRPLRGASLSALGLRKTGSFRLAGPCGNGFVNWVFDLGSTDERGETKAVECYRTGVVVFEIGGGGGFSLFPPLRLDDTAGDERTVELQMPRHCKLSGTVRQRDGAPVAANLVIRRAFEEWSALEDYCSSDDDGRYDVVLGSPGRYRLAFQFADDDGMRVETEPREWTLTAGVNCIDLIEPDIVAAARERDRIASAAEEIRRAALDDEDESVEPEPGSIHGRLLLDDPDPAAVDISILLVRDGMTSGSDDLDEEGGFKFEHVAPGRCSIVVLASGHPRFESPPFTVTSGGSVALPEWSLAKLPELHGRIVDTANRPVAGANLALQVSRPCADPNAAPEFLAVATAESNADGNFTCRSIDGPARLFVEVHGSLPSVYFLADGAAATGAPLVLTVPSTRHLRGRIVLPGHWPDRPISVRSLGHPDRATRVTLGGLGADVYFDDAAVEEDGGFVDLLAPTNACELEIDLHPSLFESLVMYIARRALPPGDDDVDLGDWVLPAACGR